MARGTLLRGKPTPFEIGYVIGLIVGEGSFTHDRAHPALSVKLHEDDPEPLKRLIDIFGGRIFGPYCHQDRRYRLWLLRGKQLNAFVPVLEQFLPESRKRQQFIAWRAEWFGEASQLAFDDVQL